MPAATRRRRPLEDDEELEETQPRRRRRPTDEDEDERPRKRRRPEPEEDEEDEHEDEDVEEAPRGRRTRAQQNDDGDEEDAAPRRNRRGPVGRSSGRAERNNRRVASGWGAYERTRAASSDFETKFKPSGELQVVALLEEGPFHSFARHWVELKEGKRAFICPASVQYIDENGQPVEDDAECPLCDVGHKVNSPKAYLNVAILGQGKPQLAVWEIGPKVSEQLQMIDKSIGRRTSLTEIYILATASGSGLNTKYALEPLFEDDLLDLAEEEDLPLKPLTAKQRDSFELYDDTLYPVPTLKELNQVADEIA